MPPSTAKSDRSSEELWLLLAIVAFICGAWHFARFPVADHLLLPLFRAAVHASKPVAAWIPGTQPKLQAVGQWLDSAAQTGFQKALGCDQPGSACPALQATATLGNDALTVWRWPLGLLLIVLGGWLSVAHPALGLQIRYDGRRFLRHMSKFWQHLRPLRGLDLLNAPPDCWRFADHPGEWAQREQLLSHYITAEVGGVPVVRGGKLDRAKAAAAFRRQLGHPWNLSLELCPALPASLTQSRGLQAHEKALFGLFAAHLLNKRAVTAAIVADTASNHPDRYRRAHAAAEQYGSDPAVQKAVAGHRYVCTMLLALLQACWKRGRMTTRQFLWLKPLDRALFYACNSLGRAAHWVEAAGILSHFQAERTVHEYNAAVAEDNLLYQRNAPPLTLAEPWLDVVVDTLHRHLVETGEVRPEDLPAAAQGASS